MSRSPLQDFIALLPAYLRDETDANLVALAIEAQEQDARNMLDNDELLPILRATIEAQANAYGVAARETREFAKRLATTREQQ